MTLETGHFPRRPSKAFPANMKAHSILLPALLWGSAAAEPSSSPTARAAGRFHERMLEEQRRLIPLLIAPSEADEEPGEPRVARAAVAPEWKTARFHASGDGSAESVEPPFLVAIPFDAWMHDPLPLASDRWVCLQFRGKLCFARWRGIGALEADRKNLFRVESFTDADSSSGEPAIELSPAVRAHLGAQAGDIVLWRRVRHTELADGPWFAESDPASEPHGNPAAVQRGETPGGRPEPSPALPSTAPERPSPSSRR
jgi:hypothetical protein